VVEYSQDYLFFYDQLEKANLMLQGVIDLGKKSIEDPQVQFVRYISTRAFVGGKQLHVLSLSIKAQ
jgi:aminopeptidase C